MNIEKQCPSCESSNIRFRQNYITKNNGERRLYLCRQCRGSFSETFNTPAQGVKSSYSRISMVIMARTEGMGFNACCRTFKLGKETLARWENRFAALKKVLFLYSLCHKFLSQVIEGDELYTKIGKNTPPKDSEGWTIVLMERATRFIWHMECGKPDRKLFKRAIGSLKKVIEQSDSTTLITDGERRYGNLLFEVCSETIKSKKRGRPKKLLNAV